ncbi:hypothetical protein fHeYen901_241 [Yersinia phage fHe-Yen9-01]|uniref:Uncharacterized protein n=1 Tax=Yersinia phage fHe-Yen9-01 TaxID=1965363 RepID=A0A1V0DXY8_9CAUD|nr:hypothetical protein KNT60_gp240 [Yersinia phage fHe-Yen9-01]ARB06014.1 hypothetical protein fHeYen901_241 [Yersinia phage fHe-Yen9-01]
MKDLLEEYVKCSNMYVEIYRSETDNNLLLERLDAAGKALRKAASEKGLNEVATRFHIVKFISSNVNRKSTNKSVADYMEECNKTDLQNFKEFLGI